MDRDRATLGDVDMRRKERKLLDQPMVDAPIACATLADVPVVLDDPSAPESQRILLVDDDRSVLSALCAVLRNAGYRVVTAESGEAAIAMSGEFAFDVAICDRHMPGMDGIELLEKLRELQPMCQRVLLTGGLDLATTISAVNRGAITCVLEKPVRSRALVDVVREAIEGRRRMVRAYRELQARTLHAERQSVEDVFLGEHLFLALQPIHRSDDGSIFGHEALLRSSHPTLDGPATILPAAERHGLLGPLAERVAQKALEWLPQMPRNQRLFINLHPAELGDPEALAERLSLLRSFAPHIVLEITERSSLYGLSAWERSVEVIRSSGFEIAVDDLGAGYSALAVLAELQPRYIKVDMSIVRDADRHMHKQRLLDLLCRFADATSALLVAEGIETEAEATAVRHCGAHLLQGYLLGRPRVPAQLRLIQRAAVDPAASTAVSVASAGVSAAAAGVSTAPTAVSAASGGASAAPVAIDLPTSPVGNV